jgi:hypothetical protein
MNIDELTTKDAEKLWIDFLKNTNAKTKKDRKTNEVFADDASVPAISSNLMDVYATFTERGKQTEMVVWVDLGGAFLSRRQHPEKIDAFQQWMAEFGRVTRVRKVEIEQEAEELVFKDQKKEFDKLIKEEDRLKKEINDAEQRINQAKKELEVNQANQNNRRQEMERHRLHLLQRRCLFLGMVLVQNPAHPPHQSRHRAPRFFLDGTLRLDYPPLDWRD